METQIYQIQVNSGMNCEICQKKEKRIAVFRVKLCGNTTFMTVGSNCLEKWHQIATDDEVAKKNGAKVKIWDDKKKL